MKWLILLVLLAGCSEPAAVNDATPGNGSLEGVVASASLRPLIASVSITNSQEGYEVSTDEEGVFVFPDVAPGTYNVVASREGYRNATAQVEIQADRAVRGVVLILTPDPTYAKPYHQSPIRFDGFMECSIVAVTPESPARQSEYVSVNVCDLGALAGLSVGQDRSMHIFSGDAQPTFVQLELEWTPSQDASKHLLFEAMQADKFCEDPSGCLGSLDLITGEGPLIIRLPTDVLSQVGSTHDLAMRVFPYTEDPAPAGVVVQQEFEVFATYFFGYEPPASWSFVETGMVPQPTE